VLARSGRTADARATLESLIARPSDGWAPAFAVALIHLGLGETGEAEKWLEVALAERSHWLLYARVDPLFESWWTDARLAPIRATIESFIKR